VGDGKFHLKHGTIATMIRVTGNPVDCASDNGSSTVPTCFSFVPDNSSATVLQLL
jgi:hypothetical protein